MRTLLIAFTIATLSPDAESQGQKLFENERVIAWRLASGEWAPPLVRGPDVMARFGLAALRSRLYVRSPAGRLGWLGSVSIIVAASVFAPIVMGEQR